MLNGEIFRQRLKIANAHVVADTIDYLEAKFVFRTDDWDGLDKWAHFAKDSAVYDIRLTEDCIRKEDHLNLSAGMWKVYLHGNGFRDGEVVQRITTDEAVLYVNPTGTLDGEPFPEMPASVTEQILARLDNVEQNGGGGGGIAQETDPTVPAWAKQPEKPTYTKKEVGLNNVDNVRQYSTENPPPYPVLVIPYGDTTHSFEDLRQKAEQGVLIGVFREATYTAWLHTYSAYNMTFRTYEGLATRIITYLPDGTWKSERKVSGSVVKEFLYGDAVSYSDIDSAADEYCIFLYVPFSVDGIGNPTAVFAGRESKTKTATFIADIANGKRVICRLTDTVWSYEVEDFSGSSGADGFSPSASVEQTDDGAIITITDKDGTTAATVYNGKDGAAGAPGQPGTPGTPGTSVTVSSVTESTEDGGSNVVTFSDGKTLTVRNGNKGTDGAKGDKGDTGEKGDKGDKGDTGADGSDGVSVTHSWNGTTLVVTSASGTSSADLKGDKGDTGAKGEQGIQGNPGEKGEPGEKGDTGQPGYTPVRGTDYWTAADQTAIVNAVLAALPAWEGGSY